MNKIKIIASAVLAVMAVGCSNFANSSGSGPDSGCKHFSYAICWDPPAPMETGIVPAQGDYVAVPETDGVGIGPLGVYGFSVGLVYSTGDALCADFSADGYLYHCITITNGAFQHAHGGWVDGTACPTDGYIISGSFVSSTEARGSFQYVPACEITVSADYIAYLKP